ncbi:CcdB family protein [Maritimibacter sp. DP1N21-5]|uniref:CcdB family protein n=1 Tax=Maritimibacter sp. DP1N21-5 TaxID=2836867 RepID=UPI001C4519AA|nr:CcdB family protein [Maritimibacter sp. DP1N21-5]
MEEISRFDIVEAGGTLYVVVESDILPPDNAVVVIPLLRGYPGLPRLNPTIAFKGDTYVLATRLIVAVVRPALTVVGSAEAQADDITRALDMLLYGF